MILNLLWNNISHGKSVQVSLGSLINVKNGVSEVVDSCFSRTVLFRVSLWCVVVLQPDSVLAVV